MRVDSYNVGDDGEELSPEALAAAVAQYFDDNPDQVGLPGPAGDDGVDGTDGEDGRSIVSAVITDLGHLVLSYSDATNEDVGVVVGEDGVDGEDGLDGLPGADGADGSDGSNGTNGISVTGASIDGSYHLILTLSNAATVDAGYVRGATGATGATGSTGAAGATGAAGTNGTNGTNGSNGISITGASVDGSGHLILTRSSGGPIDAGLVKGADGATGATGSTGSAGATGATGATGAAGPGVPTGGTNGQVLTKTSSTDYATSWQTPSAGGGTVTTPDYSGGFKELLRTGGAFRETLPRTMISTSGGPITNRPVHTAIYIAAGEIVTSIELWCVSSGTSLTSQVFAISDSTFKVLALTTDDGATAWAANSAKKLNLTTPWTCPTSGLYYVTSRVTATTPPTLAAAASNQAQFLTPKISAGESSASAVLSVNLQLAGAAQFNPFWASLS